MPRCAFVKVSQSFLITNVNPHSKHVCDYVCVQVFVRVCLYNWELVEACGERPGQSAIIVNAGKESRKTKGPRAGY